MAIAQLTDEEILSRKEETMLMMVWNQFRRHPGAIVGLVILGVIAAACLLAPLSPYEFDATDPVNRAQAPSLIHLMGTDKLGRDLFTRVLYGGRISLMVGLGVVLFSLVIGVPIGAVSGYFGGKIDMVLMRITDMALSFPALFVLILLASLLRELDVPFIQKGGAIAQIIIIASVIGILSWMPTARLVRASYLSIKEMDFVTAAQCIGARNFSIMVMHILPNALSPVIVEATLEVGWAILEESGLSFLGFGIQPPTPSWGNLLNNAQRNMTTMPWLAIFPGVMIFLAIISINYIGDGLRDALDPRKVIKAEGFSGH